jgi:hypothetical protein
MPVRRYRHREILAEYPWVDELDDPSLRAVIIHALQERRSAERHGITPRSKGIVRSGDNAIDAVRFGRVRDDRAWDKAAFALRMYTEAATRAYFARYPQKRLSPTRRRSRK